jgi:hypothetical protein
LEMVSQGKRLQKAIGLINRRRRTKMGLRTSSNLVL